jgi:hypothetical protein
MRRVEGNEGFVRFDLVALLVSAEGGAWIFVAERAVSIRMKYRDQQAMQPSQSWIITTVNKDNQRWTKQPNDQGQVGVFQVSHFAATGVAVTRIVS